MKTLTHYRPMLHAGLKPWTAFPIENRLRRFFGPDFFPEFYEETLGWTPEIDLVQATDEWLLTVELPGMKMDDIDIDVIDDVLTLKGEKKRFKELAEENYKVSERAYGMFERSFTLPRGVEVDKIKAELEHGVLIVHLPFAEEVRGRRIPIKGK